MTVWVGHPPCFQVWIGERYAAPLAWRQPGLDALAPKHVDSVALGLVCPMVYRGTTTGWRKPGLDL